MYMYIDIDMHEWPNLWKSFDAFNAKIKKATQCSHRKFNTSYFYFIDHEPQV